MSQERLERVVWGARAVGLGVEIVEVAEAERSRQWRERTVAARGRRYEVSWG